MPEEAIPPLRRAVQLSHNAPLIEMLLGQALVASDNPAYSDEAIRMLRNALVQEPEAPIGYMQLAMAYGSKGDLAEADLASAQAAYLRGDSKTARGLAIRAKRPLPVGSPGWVKADDIVNTKPTGQRTNARSDTNGSRGRIMRTMTLRKELAMPSFRACAIAAPHSRCVSRPCRFSRKAFPTAAAREIERHRRNICSRIPKCSRRPPRS